MKETKSSNRLDFVGNMFYARLSFFLLLRAVFFIGMQVVL